MFDIDLTFFWTAVNLGIIYFVLNKFLFKRLGVFMEKRSESIASDIEKGGRLKAEGEQFRRQYEEMFDDAADKRREIINEAAQKASKEAESILAEAKKEADRILKAARAEAEREREQLLNGLRKDVADLAILAASKVIEANMDNDKNRELVIRLLSGEEAA